MTGRLAVRVQRLVGTGGWRPRGAGLAALLLAATTVLLSACGAPAAERGGAVERAPAASAALVTERAREAPAAPADGFGGSVGFRSRTRLEEHFRKHGAEFAASSAAEYLRQAQTLRDAPLGGDILELRRPDGSRSRYDRASGAFVAFDADGTIRTFFKPNDGEQYFRRQARRRGAT